MINRNGSRKFRRAGGAAGVVLVLMGAGCGDGATRSADCSVVCGRPRPVHVSITDTTVNVEGQRDNIDAAMLRDAEVAAADLGGRGGVFVAGAMGGGPADLRMSEPIDLGCKGTRRQCQDPKALADRLSPVAPAIEQILTTGSTVEGSDPIGSMYSVLKSATAYRASSLRITVYTDGVAAAGAVDVSSVDLTDPQARADLINDLAGKGFDFSKVILRPGDQITIVLIGGDVTGTSSVSYEGMRELYTDLLAATGGNVAVVNMTTARPA